MVFAEFKLMWLKMDFDIDVKVIFITVCIVFSPVIYAKKNVNVIEPNVQTIKELVEHENYTEAFPLVVTLAKRGNPELQRYLGVMYENGYGVKRNPGTASEWYEKAIDNGSISAAYNLSILYINGSKEPFFPPNEERALELLMYSSDRGFVKSQYLYGRLLLNKTSSDDKDKGANYINRAANNGYSDAQIYMGDQASEDDNIKKALLWYEKAAKSGSRIAMRKILALDELYNANQINADDIFTWKKTLLLEGFSRVSRYIKNEDYESSINELKALSDTGLGEADFLLSVFYMTGPRKYLNIIAAEKSLINSANNGYEFSKVVLSKYYQDGTFNKDDKLADLWARRSVNYLEKMTENNNSWAPRILGINYLEGLGVTRDTSRAIALLNLAVERGDELSKLVLARCYKNGIGVKVDMDKSKSFSSDYKEIPQEWDADPIGFLLTEYL